MDLHLLRLFHLRNKGFSPRVIYDIGAFQGEWSREIGKVFSTAQFYLFEANEDNREALSRQSFPFFLETLGDGEREAPFYCSNESRSNTGESLFCEQTAHFAGKNLQVRTVKMTTLASVVEKHGLPNPDLVKLDVQGAETLIVNGSRELICQAEAVIVETKILAYNKGAPLIHETIALMISLGYRIYDLLHLHYLPSSDLNEIDLLFVKNHSKIFKN